MSALCLALFWALGAQRWKGLVLVQLAALLWALKEYLITLASNAVSRATATATLVGTAEGSLVLLADRVCSHCWDEGHKGADFILLS